MSQTYSIACKDCKVHLWIGQGHHKLDALSIYTGDDLVMLNLRDFLIAHYQHNLFFTDNCTDEIIDDYKEIEL